MRQFFQIQRVFTLVALVAFLGLAISCDSGDDDSSSSGGGSVFKFRDGLASTNATVVSGAEVVTDHGSPTTSSTVLATDKLPQIAISAHRPKICSVTLEKSGSPTITLWKSDDEAGTDIAEGADTEEIAQKMIETLGGEDVEGTWTWETTYQGYKFTMTTDLQSTASSTARMKVKVKPLLNVAYKLVFTMAGSAVDKDCSNENPVTLTTAAFLAAPKSDEGKGAKAIKVFEKGKDGKAGSITLDEFEIDLLETQQTATQLVAFLISKVRARLGSGDDAETVHFGSNAEEYKKGPYVATKGASARACGVTPASKWKSGSACLILTRVLWGIAGNASLKYKEDYTKAK